MASAKKSGHELCQLSLTETSALIQKKTVSPVEITTAYLHRIEQLNPVLNSYITVTAESALEEAKAAEAEIARGAWRGPLHGVPIAVKDLLETTGVRTTAASAVLKHHIPSEDAEVVRRMRAAGAVLLGKLNLHEFAYGGSGTIGHFGAVRNPWNIAHVTGGSSSGSAAAVAAGMCAAAIGTDTAGSIRLPAACCGITGLKPSYGLVSTRGVIPLSWTLDHVGPMTRTAADAALLLQVIASYDHHDTGSRKFPPVYYPSSLEDKTASLRLGVPPEYWSGVDKETEQAASEALGILGNLTSGSREIDFSAESDYTIVRCESYVYHQKYLPAHAHEYHPETLRRINAGADVTAAQYIASYRDLLRARREVLHLFEQVDVIVTPTSPLLPPSFAELEKAPQELRSKELVMLRNTRPFNVFGLPAISVPCGFSQSVLPIGLQLAAAPGSEGILLALAHAFQKETAWHKKEIAELA
ncbi:MAG TPA: amidase [Candidatus Angelobacter sp.]|nr:amidase [Candidatus Angelobacter sp.]